MNYERAHRQRRYLRNTEPDVSQWICCAGSQRVLPRAAPGLPVETALPRRLSHLFDKDIEGFGELFRQISFDEIGTSTIQSQGRRRARERYFDL